MTPEMILTLSAVVKSAIQEFLFWSQGKTREQIIERQKQEEAKTDSLIQRMQNPGSSPPEDTTEDESQPGG